MVKWLVGVLAILAVAASAGADRYAQKAPEAPVLPKGLNAEGFAPVYAPQQPQQDTPVYQPQTSYAPQQPAQQAPVPQPQPVYQPQPVAQQPPAPQPQPYQQPAQQPPAPQPQPQQPYAQPAPQPQAEQPLHYAPPHEAPQPQPAPQQTYGPAPQPQNPYAPVQQAPPKPSYDCSGKSDGLYPLGRCHPQYIRCVYGNPMLETCPASLVFSEDRCDYKDACMNPTPPPPPPQQQPPSGYGPQIMPYGQAPVQQTPPAPRETWCQDNNLIEGYHAPECSNVYYACFPLDTIKVTCPGGLFYDKEIQACDYKSNVVACGGRRPVPPPAQTQPINPYAPAPAQQQPAPQTYQPAPQPQPQQPYGQPAQQPPAPQPQPSYGQPAPQLPYAPVQQQTPPKPVDNFCRNRADGFHGKACSNFFYVCAAGQATKLDCPAGLWYDKDTNECGHKDVIVGCGGRKPTPPPAQQPPMSQGPYGQRPTPPARQPPARPEFDCSNRKDGIYVRGCNSKYYICLQSTTMPLSCPPGTFYSALTENCDYKANVVECGGIAPTQPPVAQNPVQIPQSPYGRQPQAPVQQQPPASQYGQPAQQPPVAPQANNPCATLSNGIYGRKCSRFFFVCATKKTYDFICPKDHAFNLKTIKCAPKVEIDVCPEFDEIEQPVQQSPPRPIEIQPQTSYAPQQPAQQPPAPQPQQPYGAPVQQQPPAPQPQSYAPIAQQPPAPQPQSYAPVAQQPPAPQQPRGQYVQQPAAQPPVAPQQTYQAPPQQQQPPQQGNSSPYYL